MVCMLLHMNDISDQICLSPGLWQYLIKDLVIVFLHNKRISGDPSDIIGSRIKIYHDQMSCFQQKVKTIAFWIKLPLGFPQRSNTQILTQRLRCQRTAVEAMKAHLALRHPPRHWRKMLRNCTNSLSCFECLLCEDILWTVNTSLNSGSPAPWIASHS